MRHPKTVTIVSPFAFSSHEAVTDGLRLRIGGLLEGLTANNVTVYLATPSPAPNAASRSPQIIHWRSATELAHIVQKSDIIITSYAYLGFAKRILDLITDRHTLVCDALVPILLENHATNRLSEIDRNDCLDFLLRSDVILASSQAAVNYYSSLIAHSSARLQPDPAFIVCPFGIDEQEGSSPKRNSGGSLSLLWYGGVYPWFGVEHLESFLKTFPDRADLSFTLVGVENPSTTDDYLKAPVERVLVATKRKPNVRVLPWLPFKTRLNYLNRFDACLFFNQEDHPETMISWRTRYSDLILAGVPLIVNTSDPFSSQMIEFGTARLMDSNFLSKDYEDSCHILAIRQEIDGLKLTGKWNALRRVYSHSSVTRSLATFIRREL